MPEHRHTKPGKREPSQRSLRRRILSGSAWLMGNRMLVAVLGVGINMLLARLLPPAEMGVYFLATTIATMLGVAAQIGVPMAQVRLVAERIAEGRDGYARATLVTAFRCAFFAALAVAAVLFFGLGQWLADVAFESVLLGGVVGWLAFWVFIHALQRQLAEAFRGLQDLRAAAVFGGSVSGTVTLLALLGFWLLRGSATFEETIFVTVGGLTLSALLAGILLRKRLHTLKGPGLCRNWDLLSVGWPLMFAAIANLLLTRADLWILGMYLPPNEVALYGAAARLIQIVAIPMVVASAVLSPIIAELNRKSEKARLEIAVRATATLGGIPALVAGAALMVAGGPILGIVYGDYYQDGAQILAILVVGQLVSISAGVCAQILMMTGHQRLVMTVTAIVAFGAIAAAVALVEGFGPVGVAVTFSSGVAISNLALVAFAFTRLQIRTYVYLNPLRIRDLRRARR